MTNTLTLTDIETLSETVDLECKLAAGKDGRGQLPTDFWKTYSAFANTHGGVILLGVREKSGQFSVHGVAEPEKVITNLFNTINNPQKVSTNLLTDQSVTTHNLDGKTVIRVEVPAAHRHQKPVFLNGNPFQGNTYRRLHDGDRHCDDETVKRMLAEQVEDARDGRILVGYTMEDIDPESLRVYRQMLRDAKPGHTWLELDDGEFLKCIRGWRRDRQTGEEGFTLAGLLMFGKWEALQDAVPHYFVDYQERPEAKTELRWIDRLIPDGTWSGNLFDFYRRVYRKLTTDLKVPFTLKGGQRQEDTPVHVAIREALVNTLVHADYSGRVSVLVVRRPDMFGFRNPGNMRIPSEQAVQGGESDCRNRNIHQMFLMIGLGERAGSGVPKIVSGWKSQHWRPPALYEKDEPQQTLLELRMIDFFPEEVVNSLREQLGSAFDGLSELERLILATVATEQVTTHHRIAEISTDHAHDLTQAFQRLVKAGWLKSNGHGRGTVYHLPGQALPTPDQVFGEATPGAAISSDHLKESSNHLEVSSDHLATSSDHLLENSDHSKRTKAGWLEVPELAHPLIDNLSLLHIEVRQELAIEAFEAQDKKKIPKNEMEEIILSVCDGYYLTLQALADLVMRTPNALRQNYLKPLVDQGKLALAFPTHTYSSAASVYDYTPEKAMITEDQLEQLCLGWFRASGYEYAYGPDIAPEGEAEERQDYRQVVLFGRLLAAMQRINPHIPAEVLEEAALTVAKPESPILIHNNRAFHRLLLEGVPVEYQDNDESRHDHAQLIDFANLGNNQFLVVNQFSVQGANRVRRPDLVVFINGLPVAVLELKNPADENADVWDAYNQLQTYKEEIADLFCCNEALVVSDGLTARIGSLTASREWFLPWRTIRDENDQPQLEYELEKVVRGFFAPELLLDYLRYFVLFEQDNDAIVKKIAGYHQFHAVREAVRATVIAAAIAEDDGRRSEEPRATYGREVVPGSRKAGVVWHTQGSGKSISMCCYAGKLLQQPEMNNPTIVVVTDRNDLDGQLFNTFCNGRELLRQTPQQADSRDALREKLAARQSGGILFTTVQKFSLLNGETTHPLLSGRHNIVVISDEAHRSQYGLKAKLDSKSGRYLFGYAKHMRDALPNATFIGFTGTPISQEDKDTRAVFGDYVSIYDIQDAVEDRATVPIYYESRLAKLDINREEIDELNREVEEIIEDEEDVTLREKTKGKWAALEKLVGAERRLREVATDLVQHFETRTAVFPGKAMIVCMSREICVHMYNAITALRPEWHDPDPEKGAIKIVMTGSASDRELLRPHIHNKQTKKRLEKRFKDAGDPMQLVIVRDMWLTGFDAPCCHTMYVDKPMRGHNLMQAIARVNRVFKDKPGGLVVDYLGIANELKQALKTYTDAKGKGAPTLEVEEAYDILAERLEVVRAMFAGFDYSDFATNAAQLLPLAANHIFALEDGKKRFLDVMAAITRAFSLCSTLDEVEPLRKEIAFFTAIRAAICKYTTVDKKRSEEARNSALKQVLDNAVIAEGVADIFALAGLDKPNIALLSDEFLEDVRKLPSRNLAVELLEKLLRDAIKARTRNNVVQELKYGERLLKTLQRYHARAIETAQVIEELIEMAKDFQAAMARDEALGLAPDEIAFYDALANNESAVRELGDAILKQIAHELTEKLRASTTVDWQVRDSVRAKMRNLVRRLLKKYKYPPDKQAEAVELVLQQAEVLSASWSAAVP